MTRIKQLRKFFGYTQQQLATILNVSRSTVAMWETSSQRPDYDILKVISEKFSVPPDFILGSGIFEYWDDIVKYYESVVFELKELIPSTLEMPSFCGDRCLVAWLDTRLYSAADEFALVRWFDFAVAAISIVPWENSPDGSLCADVEISFTRDFEALIQAENNTIRQRTVLSPVDYFHNLFGDKAPLKVGARIPVLGDVAAGIPIEAITDIVDYEEIDATLAANGEYFGLRIKGASMEPRMRDGDVVIVRKQETAETGDTVVVLVNGDSATVKKIKIGSEGITLVPTNPAYDVQFYSSADVELLPVRVIGRVVELRAKY